MTPSQPRPRPARRRKMLIVALALFGAVMLAQWIHHIWTGDPYPTATPVVTAQRLEDHTQSVYETLALPQAQLVEDWPTGGLAAEASCDRRGLRHWSDAWDAAPPSEPGAVYVRTEWAVENVTRAQAASAIKRVRASRTSHGWELISYENSRYVSLRLREPGSGDTVSVDTYPGGRLAVHAGSECARYPSGTATGYGEEPDLPAPTAPTQLRRG